MNLHEINGDEFLRYLRWRYNRHEWRKHYGNYAYRPNGYPHDEWTTLMGIQGHREDMQERRRQGDWPPR